MVAKAMASEQADAEEPFDLGKLQAQVELHNAQLSKLADSWLPKEWRVSASDGARVHSANTVVSTPIFATRPARLGLGATPPKSTAEAEAENSLRRKLLGKRKAGEATDAVRNSAQPKADSDDDEDSRASAIQSRPLFNPPSPVKPSAPPTPPVKKTVHAVSFYGDGAANSTGLMSKNQLKRRRKQERKLMERRQAAGLSAPDQAEQELDPRDAATPPVVDAVASQFVHRPSPLKPLSPSGDAEAGAIGDADAHDEDDDDASAVDSLASTARQRADDPAQKKRKRKRKNNGTVA